MGMDPVLKATEERSTVPEAGSHEPERAPDARDTRERQPGAMDAEALLEGLNAEQAAAVRHERGPLLILAGPGSGKTRVICHRIAWLITRGVARADNVLAVTFTNKAAGEMRDRLARLLDNDRPGVRLSTFHALCARILRIDGAAIDVPDRFVIYDRDDQLRAAREAIKALDFAPGLVSAQSLAARISRWKMRYKTPGELRMTAHNHRERQLAEAFAHYERTLRRAAALDFDDLLIYGATLMTSNDEVRDRWRRRCGHVLVDEYQDTNETQYLLTRALAEEHRNVCVVGDPDQSIYAWRGADIRNIDLFQKDFPELKVVRLERNYRSRETIVARAATLIEHNPDRPAKRMWTGREGGDGVKLLEAQDDVAEGAAIAEVVRSAGGKPRGTAVLYRMNAQSRAIEDALRLAGLRYHIVGNIRFYERREIKDILAYLKVVINPDDDISLRRIVNVPPRRIGARTIERIEALAADAGAGAPLLDGGTTAAGGAASLWQKLTLAVDRRALGGAALANVRTFRTLIERMRAAVDDARAADSIMEVLNLSGYVTALRGENTEEANERIANVMELASATQEYESGAERPSLREFVDSQSLLSEADEGNGPDDAEVWLMTLHAAKGLEFPTVVIAGLEEGLLPHGRSAETDAGVREERRLCYVGMTRAMDRLLLTRALRRRRYGSYEMTAPSRFLAEMAHAPQRRKPAEGRTTPSGIVIPSG